MQYLNIQGIETKATKSGNTKYILMTPDGKFYFYQKTKNGPSKVYQQYQKYGFKIGDTVQAEVKSEEKTFTNDQGKEITFMDNWIQFFGEVEGAPQFTSAPQQQTAMNPEDRPLDPAGVRAVMTEVLNRLANIEKRLQGLETLNTDMHGKEAVEFHQSFTPQDPKKLLEDNGIPVIDEVPWEENPAPKA